MRKQLTDESLDTLIYLGTTILDIENMLKIKTEDEEKIEALRTVKKAKTRADIFHQRVRRHPEEFNYPNWVEKQAKEYFNELKSLKYKLASLIR